MSRSEDGFSLIEVLIVTILLGILAAIAIPAFTGQTSKGGDAAAKTDVRTLAVTVAGCRTGTSSYADCDSPAELGDPPDLSWGPAAGQVSMTAAGTDSFEAVAVSRSRTDDQNHTFTWELRDDGTVRRPCTGCAGGSW